MPRPTDVLELTVADLTAIRKAERRRGRAAGKAEAAALIKAVAALNGSAHGVVRLLKNVTDASGHEHRGKGPGGGQFVGHGGGGGDKPAHERIAEYARSKGLTADTLYKLDDDEAKAALGLTDDEYDDVLYGGDEVEDHLRAAAEPPAAEPPPTPTGPGWSAAAYYHASNTPIDRFADVTGRGVSFTTTPGHARGFGRHLHEVRLKIENPLDLTDIGSGDDPDSDEAVTTDQLRDRLAEAGITIDFGRKSARGWTTALLAGHMPEIIRQAKALGHDALLVTDNHEVGDAEETVVFDPEAQVHVVGRTGPPVRKAEPPPAADPHAALYEALLGAVIAARGAGDDAAVPGLVAAYRDHLDDPDLMAAALAGAGGGDVVAKAVGRVFLKAANWRSEQHPRDKAGRFIAVGRIEAAATDPKVAAQLRDEVAPADAAKLDAAIADPDGLGRTKRGRAKHEARQRREKRAADHRRAGELADKVADGSATYEELHELGDHLEGLTLDKLHYLQARIPTTGGRRKADVVAALRASLDERRRAAHGDELAADDGKLAVLREAVSGYLAANPDATDADVLAVFGRGPGKDAAARVLGEVRAGVRGAAAAAPEPSPAATAPEPRPEPATAAETPAPREPASTHPLGDWSRPTADGAGTVEPAREGDDLPARRIRVQHGKGYAGKLGNKSWVARIGGSHPQMGFDRDFLDADEMDWGDSELYRKNKGTYHSLHDVDPAGGVYEVNEHGDRKYRIYYPVRKNGKPDLMYTEVSADALKAAYAAAAEHGLPPDDLPHVAARFGKYDGTLAERVARYADALNAAPEPDLAAGKPVPPEVLADYPDLAPKPTAPTPADHEEAMAAAHRDALLAEANAPQPSPDDHDREREEAAADKADRMAAWAADKPGSVAAGEAAARAEGRVEAARAGGEGRPALPVPAAPPKPARKPRAAAPTLPTLDLAAAADTHESIDGKPHPTRAAAAAVPGAVAVARGSTGWLALREAPAKPAGGAVTGLDDAGFARAVQDAADGHHTGFGRDRVYIGDVYDALAAKDPALTRAEFDRRLIDASRAGAVALTRADLAQLLHPDDQARSEVRRPGLPGAAGLAHFVGAADRDRTPVRGPDHAPRGPADPLAPVREHRAMFAPDHPVARAIDAALHNGGGDLRQTLKQLGHRHAELHGAMSPTDEAAYTRMMESLGAKPLHAPGEEAKFDPETMRSDTGMSTGTPVRVVHRGWTGLYGDATVGHELIGNNWQRALVEPAGAGRR